MPRDCSSKDDGGDAASVARFFLAQAGPLFVSGVAASSKDPVSLFAYMKKSIETAADVRQRDRSAAEVWLDARSEDVMKMLSTLPRELSLASLVVDLVEFTSKKQQSVAGTAPGAVEAQLQSPHEQSLGDTPEVNAPVFMRCSNCGRLKEGRNAPSQTGDDSDETTFASMADRVFSSRFFTAMSTAVTQATNSLSAATAPEPAKFFTSQEKGVEVGDIERVLLAHFFTSLEKGAPPEPVEVLPTIPLIPPKVIKDMQPKGQDKSTTGKQITLSRGTDDVPVTLQTSSKQAGRSNIYYRPVTEIGEDVGMRRSSPSVSSEGGRRTTDGASGSPNSPNRDARKSQIPKKRAATLEEGALRPPTPTDEQRLRSVSSSDELFQIWKSTRENVK
eukprot:Opistho-2@24229